MKQNEIMIDDWVQDRADQSIFKVDGHWAIYSAKDFVPVPITQEILDAIGFKDDFFKTQTKVLEVDNKHIIGYDIYNHFLTVRGKGEDDDDLLTARNICYVHELQHALKFCGIDKEIKL